MEDEEHYLAAVQSEDFLDALATVETTIRKITAKQEFIAAAEVVGQVSRVYGLDNELLWRLADLVRQAAVSRQRMLLVLSLMIPRTTISEDIPMEILEYTCFNNIQLGEAKVVVLLRWVLGLLKFGLIEKMQDLYYVNDFFYPLLGSRKLCPTVCYLLMYIMAKNAIGRSNVVMIWRLLCLDANQPELWSLLNMHKMMRPDLAPMQINSARLRWREVYLPPPIQQGMAMACRRARTMTNFTFDNHFHLSNTVSKAYKKIRLDVDYRPELHMHEAGTWRLHDCRTWEDIVSHIHHLQLPSCIIPLLGENFVRTVVTMHPDPSVLQCLEFWLHSKLNSLFTEDCQLTENDLDVILNDIASLQEVRQQGLQSTTVFLKEYLKYWDGYTCFDSFMKLVQRVPLLPFADLKVNILDPLKLLILYGNETVQTKVFKTILRMVTNMVVVEWQRIGSGRDSRTWIKNDFPARTLMAIFTYIREMLEDAYVQNGKEEFFFLLQCRFYREINAVRQQFNMPFIVQPPSSLIYLGLQTVNPLLLNETFGLLNSYSDALYSKELGAVLKKHSLRNLQVVDKLVRSVAATFFLECRFADSFDMQVLTKNPPSASDNHLGILPVDYSYNMRHHWALSNLTSKFRSSGGNVTAAEKKLFWKAVRKHFPEVFSFAQIYFRNG